MTTIQRLRAFRPTDKLNAWLITIVITLFAFVIRLVNLAFPNRLIFDETYYAKDGWTLIHLGYEGEWPKTAVAQSGYNFAAQEVGQELPVNDLIIQGQVNDYQTAAEYVVHPPLGKWLIGLGEQIFGMNSFGWRISACVFGALLVFFTIRMARRLSRSTLVGALAGLFITVDGLAFTMSRVALLDIFQATFLIAAVCCCLADRDYYRERLARKLEAANLPDFGGEFGPYIWLRPWRLAAGVMFGCAIAVKWNSVYLLAAMGILSVWWDCMARRLAGAEWKSFLAIIKDGIPAFVRMVVVAAGVYVASWTGWFLTSGGYDRQWGYQNPADPITKAVGPDIAGWVKYHIQAYEFHTGKYMMQEATHSYESNPFSWFFVIRPTAMDAINGIKPGTDGCPADATSDCLRVINGMGTPILWWAATIALVVCVVWWIGDRDWRFGLPVIGTLAMWLPWVQYMGRPTFYFYSICFIPFMATGLAMCLGLALGAKNSKHRFRNGLLVTALVALIVADFAFIYPIVSDGLLTRAAWQLRIWLPGWV
ncbi:MAG: phospholipid carrier-dependent glycosyltransferase [Propionibacteriaceae bacterium]|nr:phospholipid carrier-dependent glycosyltransferase [Propionibacteriaceae bacterium]